LRRRGYKVSVTREPGGTALGEKLRMIVKTETICDRAELLCFEASRAELVDKVLLPKLKAGHIILCDRFLESSLVYQGMTRGLPLKEVAMANLIATGGLKSDFIVLLEGSHAKDRLKNRISKDRIERESELFHRKVSAS